MRKIEKSKKAKERKALNFYRQKGKRKHSYDSFVPGSSARMGVHAQPRKERKEKKR
jgi:hypothetical protein